MLAQLGLIPCCFSSSLFQYTLCLARSVPFEFQEVRGFVVTLFYFHKERMYLTCSKYCTMPFSLMKYTKSSHFDPHVVDGHACDSKVVVCPPHGAI